MALTNDFDTDGAGAPTDWTFEAPAASDTASVAVADSRVKITVPTGKNRDSIFSTGSSDLSAGIVTAVPDHGGDIDVAVQLDTDVSDLKDLGFNLLFKGSGSNAARVGWYMPNTAGNYRPRVYMYARASGSGAQITNSNITAFMSAVPAWVRAKYTAATGTWEALHSGDGVNWISHASGVRSFTATTVKFGVTTSTSTPTKTVHINGVVDILAAGSTDVRDPDGAPDLPRDVVAAFDGTDGALPTGFVDDSIGGSSLTWTGSVLRLRDVGNATTRGASSARLRWTGTQYEDCGVLMRVANTDGDVACYLTVGFVAPRDGTWFDQYIVRGDGYGLEVQSGSIRRPLRIDDPTDGNVAVAPEDSSTGLDETPYCWMRDLTGYNMRDGGTRWFRAERNGRRYRAKEWADGEAEPAGWDLYDGQDEVNRGPTTPALSLSRNSLTTETVDFDISSYEFYRLSDDVTGVLNGELPTLTGSFAGSTATAGVLAGTLPTPSGALTGGTQSTGVVAGNLPPLAGSFVGAAVITGGVAGVLPSPTGSIVGEGAGVSGALTGQLPSLTGAIAGNVTDPTAPRDITVTATLAPQAGATAVLTRAARHTAILEEQP